MPEGSIVRRERCHATTTRRGLNRRCMHDTLRGIYCHQHEKQLRGLRIMKSEIPDAGMGVFTTKVIPKGATVCQYTGDEVVEKDPDYANPYALQIKKKPPTFIVADETNEPGEGRWVNDGRGVLPNNAKLVYNKKSEMASVKALRKIEVGEEILVDYGEEYPWREPTPTRKEVVPKRKPAIIREPSPTPPAPRKKKLIKPDHGPEPEDWPAPAEEPEPPITRPKPKPKPKVKRSGDEKFQIDTLKRLVALQDLWDDKDLNRKLKLPQVKHQIAVPDNKGNYTMKLNKLFKTERQLWVDHVNQNPRNRMTMDRAFDIIDKAL